MTAGTRATLKVRISQADAHYGGGLVAGAKVLELFGDVATELCIRTDGDEGLFAGYSSVEFLAPVSAGDFLEVTGEVTRMGETSREISFTALRYAKSSPEVSDSAAEIVADPETVARATGTCVVRKAKQRGSTG
ncbi:MAG: hotdog fold thioesterase [Actinomycetota bacterium]|nr:hotdog fold thioesterase [Actinomycetota bacterium]